MKIATSWTQVPEFLDAPATYVDSMQARCQAVIDANRGHTEY